jgi:hypothetical protein
MASLQDYVAGQFPNHEIEVRASGAGDLELTEHTVVSWVVGSGDGTELLNAVRRSAPSARIAALDVRPSDPSVVPTADEDRDGVVDLPGRRVATFVVGGALVLGVVFGLLMLLISDSNVTAAIVGVFAALIGAAVGAIVGGSRFAGQRATSQPNAPGRNITVVAAFLDDDASASSLARSIGAAADYQVRIVDRQAGWHSPGTASG